MRRGTIPQRNTPRPPITHRPPLRQLPDDPRVNSFLPLIYVAWADSEPEDDEIRAVCRRIHRGAPDRGCQDLLGRWLDPASPPSAEEPALLLEALRGAPIARSRSWIDQSDSIAGR